MQMDKNYGSNDTCKKGALLSGCSTPTTHNSATNCITGWLDVDSAVPKVGCVG